MTAKLTPDVVAAVEEVARCLTPEHRDQFLAQVVR